MGKQVPSQEFFGYRSGARIQEKPGRLNDCGDTIEIAHSQIQREVESNGLRVFARALTNSRVKTVFGSVTYRQSRRLNLTLDAALENRETNDARFDYDNTRVGLTAGVRY